MTTKTRRRVLLAAVLLTLTLPAEIVMLRALQDDQTVAQQWAAGLDQNELAAASQDIESYSFAYRRQIMVSLSATGRAGVWQRHIGRYLTRHPELDANSVEAIKAAQALVTPALLSNPTTDERAASTAAAERVQRLVGPDVAQELFYYLGPRDRTFASADPIVDRLARYVRDKVVVLARASDCECSVSFGCGGYSEVCRSDGYDCQYVVVWPACGWFWNEPCDGMCQNW